MIPGMGMNPKQLKQMQRAMKQMGMDMKDLRGVEEVVIKLKKKEDRDQEPQGQRDGLHGTEDLSGYR